MKNVFEILRLKRGELRHLQQEVEALEIAARLLADDHDQDSPDTSAGKLSQTQMIKAVLELRGAPMHVGEIAAAVEKKFRKKLKVAYVAPVIYRQLDKMFSKADKPNTFGLVGWTIRESSSNGSPPRPQVTHGAPLPPQAR